MTIAQWRAGDLRLHTEKTYRNPFADVDVFADFEGPNGERLHLLAFWDGGGDWIVRFAPTAPGLWRYRTSATDENPDFATAGEVTCTPYDGDLPIYRHGFLRVSADRSHLEHADGTPFLWLGDTHWTFATEERFEESNCPDYKSQFCATVDLRKRQGFTVYLCNFRDGAGAGSFGKNIPILLDTPDGPLPNIELLHADIDRKMQYLADAGLVIAVGYAWSNDIFRVAPGHYEALAKYLAARYGALPVIWTLAGELPGYNLGERQKLIDLWRPVAESCAKWCAYDNLQTVHLATGDPIPETYEGEACFDFALNQTGHGDLAPQPRLYADYRQAHPDYPIVEGECFYEGIWSNELCTRIVTPSMFLRSAYLNMQTGGCGFTYGANGVWELQWEAGVGGIGWRDMAWWDGLRLPGADMLTRWKDFYESVGWANLKPVPEEQISYPGFWMPTIQPIGQAYFTANEDRTTIVGYFSDTSWRAFCLEGVQDGTYTGYFLQPVTGEKTPVRLEATGGKLSYQPATRGKKPDCVLALFAQA